jgi:hypothetical protein
MAGRVAVSDASTRHYRPAPMRSGVPGGIDGRSARQDTTTKKANHGSPFQECLAEWTGLEPATPGVTGRYSNQLNYHSMRTVRFGVTKDGNGLDRPHFVTDSWFGKKKSIQ